MKLAFALACMLLAQAALADCAVSTDSDLKQLEEKDLVARYCAARVNLSAESAVQSLRQQPLPGTPGAQASARTRGAMVGNCYTEVSRLLDAMEQRKIDVDAALKQCAN